eukprot:gene7397-biopygen19549
MVIHIRRSVWTSLGRCRAVYLPAEHCVFLLAPLDDTVVLDYTSTKDGRRCDLTSIMCLLCRYWTMLNNKFVTGLHPTASLSPRLLTFCGVGSCPTEGGCGVGRALKPPP